MTPTERFTRKLAPKNYDYYEEDVFWSVTFKAQYYMKTMSCSLCYNDVPIRIMEISFVKIQLTKISLPTTSNPL